MAQHEGTAQSRAEQFGAKQGRAELPKAVKRWRLQKPPAQLLQDVHRCGKAPACLVGRRSKHCLSRIRHAALVLLRLDDARPPTRELQKVLSGRARVCQYSPELRRAPLSRLRSAALAPQAVQRSSVTRLWHRGPAKPISRSARFSARLLHGLAKEALEGLRQILGGPRLHKPPNAGRQPHRLQLAQGRHPG